MKIAVTSQNFKSVTGHAGTSRRFIIFDAGESSHISEVMRLDLPKEMAFHEFSGYRHPLDSMDVILTASAGQGFVDKLAQRGVQVITCGESEAHKAVCDYLAGTLKEADPYDHHELEHHEHAHESCGCGEYA